MKRLIFTCLMALAAFSTQAAPDIIYSQPGGELRIYERKGSVATEDEEGNISYGNQEGNMSIVFASGHVVYLQDPVSGYTMAGSWVKGTLSPDSTTITVPLGQYVDYTRSFDMAYQLQMLTYDSGQKTYVVDTSTSDVTYTIDPQGGITLNGTSQEHILGLSFRTFGSPQGAAIGQDFMYLDSLWIGVGDYASSYSLLEVQVQQPSPDMEKRLYYATSAEYDGAAYSPYSGTVNIGRDGDEVWIQGISRLVPSAWVKGTAEGQKVTIPTGQFLGTLEGIPLFLHGASLNSENSFNIKDIELQAEGDKFITYDFIFVTTSVNSLQYVNFYMGATYDTERETVLEVAASQSATYTLAYQTYDSANRLVAGSSKVEVSTEDDNFYVQGIWAGLPQAWVQGRIDGNSVIFDMPQFLGYYTDEDDTYPIYLTVFDADTGKMLRQLTFAYDETAGTLSAASSPISIGINKTGYLSVQDYYSPTFTKDEPDAIAALPGTTLPDTRYDLSGRRIRTTAKGVVVRQVRQPDGSIKIQKYIQR